MKSATTFATLALAALSVNAVPVTVHKRNNIDDPTVLNFALTLEHLENAFYKGALDKFDDAAFTKAGLPWFARGRFQQVADHEAMHVKLLSDALGDKATQPCTYDFPYTDPKTFAALSQALEGVGVSAYTGAAQYIESKEYLTVAASILATEARHASWVAGAVNMENSWSGAYDSPLGLNEVFTLASQFIKSCPSSNPALPVKAFPVLTLSSDAAPGSTSTVTYDAKKSGDLFVAFYTGLGQESAPIKDGKVTIPSDLKGTVYAVVTTNGTAADATNTIAGPAILNFAFDSNDQLITA